MLPDLARVIAGVADVSGYRKNMEAAETHRQGSTSIVLNRRLYDYRE
jgi:hypothetical protein